MEELFYRDAIINDLPVIVAIYNTTIASGMVTADTAPVAVASRHQWFQEHDPAHRPLWVVENNNKEIIGWVSFQSFYGRPAYDATVEISIYLDEQQRGKGLGKKILQHSIGTAPQYGIKTLLGFIFEHNIPSLLLFQYFAFEEWAFLPKIALLYGKEYGLKILGKRIA